MTAGRAGGEVDPGERNVMTHKTISRIRDGLPLRCDTPRTSTCGIITPRFLSTPVEGSDIGGTTALVAPVAPVICRQSSVFSST